MNSIDFHRRPGNGNPLIPFLLRCASKLLLLVEGIAIPLIRTDDGGGRAGAGVGTGTGTGTGAGVGTGTGTGTGAGVGTGTGTGTGGGLKGVGRVGAAVIGVAWIVVG